MKIEGGENICHAQGASRVTGTGLQERLDDVLPDLVGDFFELLQL